MTSYLLNTKTLNLWYKRQRSHLSQREYWKVESNVLCKAISLFYFSILSTTYSSKITKLNESFQIKQK